MSRKKKGYKIKVSLKKCNPYTLLTPSNQSIEASHYIGFNLVKEKIE